MSEPCPMWSSQFSPHSEIDLWVPLNNIEAQRQYVICQQLN